MKKGKQTWEIEFDKKFVISYQSPYSLENVNENDIKAFIRSLLQAHDKAIVERLEKMKEDERPEITVWLISKDYTRGFNQALTQAQNAIKEGNHE